MMYELSVWNRFVSFIVLLMSMFGVKFEIPLFRGIMYQISL